MKFIILFFLLSFAVQARPKKVYVWFISPTTVGSNLKEQPEFSMLLVQKEENCEKVDGGCFNPQVGWVKPRKKKVSDKRSDLGSRAFLANKIICDPQNPFDIYCGKERKILQQKIQTALWIDVSGSMRSVDWSKEKGFCQRRKAVEVLLKRCKHHFQVSYFDTSLREMGTRNGACVSRGTNSTKRLISWIKNSSTKELYIVTDVEENNVELSTFLSSIGARIFGGGTSNIFMQDFLLQFAGMQFRCQK